MTLAAFARRQFILRAEETNEWKGKKWVDSNHNLDFIFERDSVAYGVEVKNTLGYLDSDEFVTKIKMARFLELKPVFVVRDLPRHWIQALAKSGGFALVMRYQFYPWTHESLAGRVRDELGLPVDTPKRIEDGTMMRLEQWISKPHPTYLEPDLLKLERILQKINPEYKP
jgi:hypothetical protein